ncbi:MAG: hypothetical protein DME32_00585 [Verrucomicrobia bacterium]|nr:MAG: hypothetical protein DME32_00585 [Verrucomicrobiota bacterium]
MRRVLQIVMRRDLLKRLQSQAAVPGAALREYTNSVARVRRVAHAARVLVSASRRNSLPESPRSRGRDRQHARRVRYPKVIAHRHDCWRPITQA